MRRRSLRLGILTACALSWVVACGLDPTHPFDREAPQVKQALGVLDAGGDATVATQLLEDYLSTGACADGKIGAPAAVLKRSNGSFDLGLSLFRMGEAYGRRFGDEELGDGGEAPEAHTQRMAQIDCALRIVQAVADDDTQPIDLRARARYLEGNLHFLGGEYEQAVTAYDKALTLAPGMEDGGDAVGRDAAFNRAIALRRIDDKKDAGNDAGNDGGKDGGNDGGSDGGNDGGSDGGSDSGDSGGGGGDDGGKDSGGPDSGPDAGHDAGQKPPENAPDAAPPPPTQSQDERMLDKLENTPTFQQELARKAAQHQRVRGAADK